MSDSTRVVALLPSSDVRRLHSRLGARFRAAWLADVAGVVGALRGAVGGTLLLEPALAQDRELKLILRAAGRMGCGVLFYTSLGRDDARRVVRMLARARAELVLRGADDDLVLIEQRLTAPQQRSASAVVLHELSPNVAALEPELCAAVAGVFGRGGIPARPSDLLTRCQRSRRSCERALARAGLAGPAALLRGARLTKAWEMLGDSRVTLQGIADAVGFASEFAMTRAFSTTTGLSARRSKRELDAEELGSRVARARRMDR